jgi:4-diphosphocytidyl-2-C-methyl-D-erythritol kinase
MTAIQVASPAKLNLYLRILSRREDGYHNLQTLFQLIDLQDTLTIEINHTGQITLDAPQCPCPPQDNLITQAATKLKHHCPPDFGCHIQLDKKIPVGGGLGGGSSNAASTLLALNQLWGIHMSTRELSKMATQLGADVPVFVEGHSAWAEGVGEQLQPTALPPRWYLILNPHCPITTTQLFNHPKLQRHAPRIDPSQFKIHHSTNDFEPIVLQEHPKINDAYQWLSQLNPTYLTGTGACLFSQFKNQKDAQAIADNAPSQWQTFVTRGINLSPCASQFNQTHP